MNTLKRNNFTTQNDLGSVLENFLRGQTDDSSFIDTGSWAPSVDIKEEKNQFLVIADIPGVNKNDINISLEENVLTLHGERHYENEENKHGYSRVERAQGKFYRRFSLPQTVDNTKIGAKYRDGVLEISIPKKEAAIAKKVNIQIE